MSTPTKCAKLSGKREWEVTEPGAGAGEKATGGTWLDKVC